jgi:hypothetical protein
VSNQSEHTSQSIIRPAPQRSLWLWWTLASLIGTTLGGGLSLILHWDGPLPSAWQQELIWLGCGALAGLITSLPQWALLRRTIPEPGWWIAVTTLGQAISWVVVHPLALVLSRQLPRSFMTVGPSLIWVTLQAMTFAIAIPSLSLLLVWSLQWYVLRAYVARARPWLRAGALCAIASWGLAVLLAVLVTDTPLWNIFRGLNGSSVWLMAFYMAGAVGSGIGGGVMLSRILRSYERQEILQPDLPSRPMMPVPGNSVRAPVASYHG